MATSGSHFQYEPPQHVRRDPASPYFNQPSSSSLSAVAAAATAATATAAPATSDSLDHQDGTAKRTFDVAFPRSQPPRFRANHLVNKEQATETTFHNYVGDPAQSLTRTPRRVGRPRKDDTFLKRPRRDPRSKPTKLRVNRPVKHGLNEDCWRLVFEHTDPSTLLGFRQVDHAFNRILTDEEHIWIANRRYHFGRDCPSPPSGIPPIRYVPNRELQYSAHDDVEEQPNSTLQLPKAKSDGTRPSFMLDDRQVKVSTDKLVPRGVQCRYVDLLAGNGCMRCGVKRSKSTQWAFLRRWCQNCYRESTVKTNEAKAILERNSKLLYCIPRGFTDRWGNYATVAPPLRRQLREDDLLSEPLDFEVHMNVFAKSDLTRIIKEFESLGSSQGMSHTSPDELAEVQKKWLMKCIKDNEERMAERRTAEEFWAKACKTGSDQPTAGSEYCKSRLDFFFAGAQQLEPSLLEEDFRTIPAVKSALKVKRPPTERAWNCLKEKILAALPYIRVQKESQQIATGPGDGPYTRHQRLGRRTDRELVCPTLVINLATNAIEKMNEAGVHDSDFALLVLRQTWASYSILPTDQKAAVRSSDILKPNIEGDHGAYVLTINDALWVYENKISPHMKTWGVQRSQVGHSLKCPGCTRTDYSKPWRMRHLLNHLRERHGRNLEKPWFDIHVLANRYNYSQGFPFPAVPWRINLPMLAQHHVATGDWNPDDTSYTRAPTKGSVQSSETSAFKDREPTFSAFSQAKLPERFAQDLMLATSVMDGSKLENKYKMRIVWEYATRQPGVAELAGRNIGTLREISIALMREGAYSVLGDCICKQCAACDNTRKPWQFHHNRDLYALHPHSFGTMIEHWDSHEQIGYIGPDNWITEMLSLPDGAEVAWALTRTGMEDANERFNSLFPGGKQAETVMSDGDSSEEQDTQHQQLSQSKLDLLADSALRQDPRT